MKEILYVFLGGGIGSVARYLLGKLVGSGWPMDFPLATFLTNIAGCFLVGLSGAWIVRHCLQEEWRLFLVVGLCGGFTTFSTFGKESLALMQDGHILWLCLYVLASVAFGIVAVWAGSKVIA